MWKCIFLSVLFFSCVNSDNKEYKEFTRYMKEVNNLNVNKYDGYFYVLHLQGCESCIEASCNFLTTLNEKTKDLFTVVLVGKYHGVNDSVRIVQIEHEFNIIYDRMQSIFNYQTNFAYPLLVEMKDGKCRRYSEIKIGNYEKLRREFLNK